jgi:hypothetical protein
MVRTCSVASVSDGSLLTQLLDVGESGRANPGENHWKQHKAVQEAQHAHDCEHGEVVEPVCMISA